MLKFLKIMRLIEQGVLLYIAKTNLHFPQQEMRTIIMHLYLHNK
jgi:hypothetical protein